HQQIAKRFLLLLVSAAVSYPDRGRNMQIAHYLLHLFNAFSQADAFKSSSDGHPPLEILPNHFALSALPLQIADGSQVPPFPSGVAGAHGGPDLVQRGSRVLGESDSDGVGAVIHDDGSGGWLALEDRAGVEFDLLRCKARPRRNDRIDIHHDGGTADCVLYTVL